MTTALLPSPTIYPSPGLYPRPKSVPPVIPKVTEPIDWRFFLADSTTMNLIGELTNVARNKTLSIQNNKAGSLSFSINQTEDIAANINPVTTCTIAYKNGVAEWSGPIWTIEDAQPEDTTNVTCVGWYELLNHRLLTEDVQFADTDAGLIAQQLIETTNSVLPTRITVGQVIYTQLRTVTYTKYQSVGSIIDSLTEVESGFDFTIDPLTKVFDIYDQNMTDRTDVIFGYKWGPNNLTGVSKSTDSSTLVNDIFVIGKGLTAESADGGSQGSYGLFQESQSLTEIVDNTVLAAFANAEIAIRAQPRIIYSITPNSSTDNYSIFEDYNLGDKIYFVCNFGRIRTGDSPQAIRIFGIEINIDENGVEKISQLQASP